ncbi:MAG TPA: hypothetical protein VFZ64_04280 [Nocardioidaceae bacterium]
MTGQSAQRGAAVFLGTGRYDAAASAARRPARPGPRDDRELVRLATLAASSHNTQPWLFRTAADSITILPDRTRRCPVVDPEDAHLYKSLGCAAENLVHAASIQGYAAAVCYDRAADAVVVRLRQAPGLPPTELSRALATRQCTKSVYDGSPVSSEDLAELERAGTGDGVRCLVITDRSEVAEVSALVERGNRAQLTDEAFRRELLAWIRFNARAALVSADGLAGRVNGQPPLPTTLGRLLAPLVVTASAQVKADRTRLGSSAGVAVFLTSHDSPASWVEAGRAYERFSLTADLLGVRSAFVNQPIEVPPLRGELRTTLGVDGQPQLMVRFGHAPYGPYSLRRPVNEVLLA